MRCCKLGFTLSSGALGAAACAGNQDNPLMAHIVKAPGYPVLGLDVWEHA